MILRSIYLFLAVDDYPKDRQVTFGFRTRYVCNFLQRRLRTLKLHAPFNAICVQGTRHPSDDCVIDNDCIVPTVAFDEREYLQAPREALHEFYLQMLADGFRKCEGVQPIPGQELRGWMQEFRGLGCRNTWVYKERFFKKHGIRATLICDLDTERFALTLQLKRGTWEQRVRVLETLPDEIIFQHKFKDVLVKGNSVVVTDSFGGEAYSLQIPDLPT